MLIVVLEYLFAEAAVFGGQTENFFVVVGNAEFLGKDVADGASAAAKLSAYVDDEFIHVVRFCQMKEMWCVPLAYSASG